MFSNRIFLKNFLFLNFLKKLFENFKFKFTLCDKLWSRAYLEKMLGWQR